jgi:hypothetical protein
LADAQRDGNCLIYDTGATVKRRGLFFDVHPAIVYPYEELRVCRRQGSQQMQGLNQRRGSVAPILVASILLFGGTALSWAEEKIGGVETVINNVKGNQAPVAQGDGVLVNEVVSSGADSRANLVLKDNSNITIGPGSTIKLDDFLYSGPKQRGEVAVSITNGTLRFTTGDANKRAYTIWTPTAAIGARGTSLRLRATPAETTVINEEGTAIVCLRKENASVEELRKPCKGREDDQAILTEGKNLSCPCTELLFPSEQATITAGGIAVAQAPLYAISEPFIGAPKDFRVTAADLPTHKAPPAPFVPAAAPAAGFPVLPVLGAGALAAGAIALLATQESHSSTSTFISPAVSP